MPPEYSRESHTAHTMCRTQVDDPRQTSVNAMFNISGSALDVIRPPSAKPAFKKGDIEAIIPPHCFNRSHWVSGSYLARDFIIIALLGYSATYIRFAPIYVQIPLWITYWFAQGFSMGGVWVIAHECGHQAFSESTFINDTVGWFSHSLLLVPYHSWKMSHSKHHKYTNSVEDDEVFVPYFRTEMGESLMEDTPLGAVAGILGILLFGWPLYLIANLAGPRKYAGKPRSHFTADSALFEDEDANVRNRNAWEVVSSDLGFFGVMGVLAFAISKLGFQIVAAFYLVPYLVVNAGLVLITFLQHTDVHIPHYQADEHDFMRGALSTVDRSYGWLLDECFHHIGSTHVVHHMFSKMPFYHAREATVAVRKVLGEYYLRDDSPFPAAIYRAWTQCKYIENEDKIAYFKGPKDFKKGAHMKKH